MRIFSFSHQPWYFITSLDINHNKGKENIHYITWEKAQGITGIHNGIRRAYIKYTQRVTGKQIHLTISQLNPYTYTTKLKNLKFDFVLFFYLLLTYNVYIIVDRTLSLINRSHKTNIVSDRSHKTNFVIYFFCDDLSCVMLLHVSHAKGQKTNLWNAQ